MSVSKSLNVIPLPTSFPAPLTPFDPTIHHVTQEQALEATLELTDKQFNIMGSLEQYSGVHPTYGEVIIIISSSSDSLIIPIS